MAALMNSVIDTSSKVTGYIMTCKSMGIEILPPDINESTAEFTVSGTNIRYGLSALKSVGKSVVEQIVEERNLRGPYKNIADLIERVIDYDVNKRIIESLIKSGALDCFEGNRRQKMQIYTIIMDNVIQSKKKTMAGQMTLFDIADDDAKADFEIKLPNVSEYTKEELLAFEKEFVGHYISGHPMDEYQTKWKKYATRRSDEFALNDDGECQVYDGARETVGGMITNVTIKTTKNNQIMAFFTLEDMYGTVEVIVFSKNYEKYRTMIAEDRKVFVTGRVSSEEEKDAKLVCDKITEFNQMTSSLWIRFDDKETYENAEKELLETLSEHSGRDNVVIYLTKEKQKKILPPPYAVAAEGELMNRLKAKYGEKNVALS
jgi:DNA polymerase-3 subunit alpha